MVEELACRRTYERHVRRLQCQAPCVKMTLPLDEAHGPQSERQGARQLRVYLVGRNYTPCKDPLGTVELDGVVTRTLFELKDEDFLPAIVDHIVKKDLS